MASEDSAKAPAQRCAALAFPELGNVADASAPVAKEVPCLRSTIGLMTREVPSLRTTLPDANALRSAPRPKMPPVPHAIPFDPGAKARRKCGGFWHEAPVISASARGFQDSQMEQLKAQNAHLREELQSLRDMYAKHTAYTELKCDRMMREKDQECTDWYKQRNFQFKDYQAATVVMHALFEKKRRRMAANMELNQEEHSGKEKDLQAQVEHLQDRREKDAKSSKELLDASISNHEAELVDARRHQAETESKASRLADQLEDSRKENDRLKETNRQNNKELEELKKRLAEVEKTADIDRRDEQIGALEAELQTTRRTLKERWKREVESLRQELMDYVRFIVHILPDNWSETEAADKVPPELKDQLSRMSRSEDVSWVGNTSAQDKLCVSRGAPMR